MTTVPLHTNGRSSARARPARVLPTRIPDESRPLRVLRIDEVMSRTGLRRTAIYELEARGDFPARVQLTARAVGWVESAVEHWLLARIAAHPRRRSNSASGAAHPRPL